jgi:hypothetical protein
LALGAGWATLDDHADDEIRADDEPVIVTVKAWERTSRLAWW